MQTDLIGRRSSFGIQVHDVHARGQARYGQCGLWLGGYVLGDPTTSVCLDAVLSSLNGVAVAAPSPSCGLSVADSASELLSLIEGTDVPAIQRHCFLPLEGFDDFLKLFWKGPTHTTFIWAVHPAVAGLDAYREYPKSVQQVVVEHSELRQVLDEFARLVANAKR
jgi:hypothetical protein